ncbi:MAG: Concanavalin A-like lectin/glucanase superfamily [Gemmatimonadetes bacterium]|nr:Concanavalin A-like lectin/glucanase superfamily [Gemmatimonadota bacterium]
MFGMMGGRGVLDPLRRLRSALADGNIAGVYWTRNGPRLAGGVVSVWDDARCSTTQGRYSFPGTSTDGIDLGNYADINGATQVTIMAWVTPTSLPSNQTVFARLNTDALANRQLQLYLSNTGVPRLAVGDGAANNIAVGTTALVLGTSYKLTAVFDGTLAAANRAKLYLSTRQADGSWSADAAEGMTFVGTIPAALISPAALSAMIGIRAGAGDAFVGFMTEVRVWNGTALSPAQVQAESLTANPVAASLRYTLDGNANNTGATAGFNGTATTGVVQCSDDLRWGPPLASSGTSRGLWDANAKTITFDTVDDYMRAVGGTLSNLTGNHGWAFVGAAPTADGRRIVSLSNGSAAAGTFMDRNTVNIIRMLGSTGGAATTPYVAGTRVIHGRFNTVGPAQAVQDGASAEVSTGSSALTAGINTLTLSASMVPAAFGGLVAKGLLVYAADYTGKAAIVNSWGAQQGATL